MRLAYIKSSPCGIISVLMAATVIVSAFVAISSQLAPIDSTQEENHFAVAMLALAVFGAVAFFSTIGAAAGLILSVISLVRNKEKRLLGVLGLALNGGILSFSCLVMFRMVSLR